MEHLKFEQYFRYDKNLYYGLIYFFDELIKKDTEDFVNILKNISVGRSCQVRENMGYNLPEDTEYENMDYVEIWWVCGLDDFNCNVDFKIFIESLELAIQLKNNNVNFNDSVISEIESCIKLIKQRYKHYV